MTRKVSELEDISPGAKWEYSKLPTRHGVTSFRIALGSNNEDLVLHISYVDPKTGERLSHVEDGFTEKATDLLCERGEKTMVGWVAKQVILRVDNS